MKKNGIIYLITIIVLVVIYSIFSIIVDNELIFPHPLLILKYIQTLKLSEVIREISSSLIKAILSYLISLIMGISLAYIARYKKFSLIINPYISILKTIPTISIILITIIWLGNNLAVYLIPILVIMPLLYENFYSTLSKIDSKLIEVANIYQFNRLKRIKYLYYYPLLEKLIFSLKQTLGLCFKIIVMAEVIGQTNIGIGAMLQNEKINLEIAGVFAWTIILIIFILIIDYILDNTAKRLIKWK